MSDRVYIVSQQLIANNIDLIAAKSWAGYQKEGRGVLLIDSGSLGNLDSAPAPLTYLSKNNMGEHKADLPWENLSVGIEKYNPNTEIIVVVKWRGKVGVYRLKPPVAPPDAYERLKDTLARGAAQGAPITLWE